MGEAADHQDLDRVKRNADFVNELYCSGELSALTMK